MTAVLAHEGITARGYTANVRDPRSLISTLDRVAQELGPIEVLQYSPLPQQEFLRPVLETTVDDLLGAVEFSIYGPVAAAHQVLQGMRSLGRGSILFENGGSSARPNAKVAGTSIAYAGEGAFARMMHGTVAKDNIKVRQLISPGAITPGHETHDPDKIADLLWRLHDEHGDFRVYVEPMPDA
ncbi:SDR family oxidoreductase [Streptomyces viridiviolaceus]